ncbi:MAG: response regulator [Candidatus Aminicenantes bacterium]|nr:response regulator [Candidatus Aminicenantes bacterium]
MATHDIKSSSLERGLLLLIDDEEVIREIGGEMFESMGFSCITAKTGEEGIKLYRERKADIRLVVLDIELPGISGEKVYEALKEINPDLKILLVSGYGKDYLEAFFFKEKVVHFVSKPFQLSKLTQTIDRLMQE